MIKEAIVLLADNIEDITKTSLEMNNCSLEECFPAYTTNQVNINGKTYNMSLEVKLKEVI